jgi:nitric-oxide synthase
MRAPLTLRATSFLRSAYEELGQREQGEQRVAAVSAEIAASGTWTPTREELTRGARMAWRNSNRCIGRLFWKTLKVIDARDCEDPDEVFEALQHHLDEAFRGGDVGSVITVFRPRRPGEREGPRIVNHQLVRFAGYVGADGRVRGDPAETAYTAPCGSSAGRARGPASTSFRTSSDGQGSRIDGACPSCRVGCSCPSATPSSTGSSSSGSSGTPCRS